MSRSTKSRAGSAVDYALTALILIGLLLFGRWFVGTIGGELDPGGVLLALGLIVVGAAAKMLR